MVVLAVDQRHIHRRLLQARAASIPANPPPRTHPGSRLSPIAASAFAGRPSAPRAQTETSPQNRWSNFRKQGMLTSEESAPTDHGLGEDDDDFADRRGLLLGGAGLMTFAALLPRPKSRCKRPPSAASRRRRRRAQRSDARSGGPAEAGRAWSPCWPATARSCTSTPTAKPARLGDALISPGHASSASPR